MPANNLVDFEMLMRLLGCSHKQDKYKKEIQNNTEIIVSETESEDLDEPKKDENDEECLES